MIEKLDKTKVVNAFPEGAPVIVALGGELIDSAVAGMLSSWSGPVCCICLTREGIPRVPSEGSKIQIIASRLDGVYRVPGVVEAVQVTRASELTLPDCELFIRVALEQGTRVQRRAFFRVSGDWRIEIDEVGESSDTDEEDSYTCRVWNLSASGLLMEDAQCQLRQGMVFVASLDLEDGDEPLDLQVETVRRDGRFPESSCAWGCRLVNPSREAERRILHFLHEKLRARFLMKHEPSTSGNPDGDAQSA